MAWTEALTLVARDHVRDDLYAMAKAPFPDEELVNLTAAVVAINGGNRVAFRFIPPVEAP